MKTILSLILAIAGLLLTTSCSKSPSYQSVLQPNETSDKGMRVYVDTLDAGAVTSVDEEAGDRVVNFQITVPAAREKIRQGVARIPAPGKIQLSTTGIQAGAEVLPNGARIPVRSGWIQTLVSYSKGSTIAVLGVALVILVVLYLIFRSLIGAAALIVCAVASGVLTSVISPYASPMVQQFYDKFPPPALRQGSPSTIVPTDAPGGLIGEAIGNIKEVVLLRPDPTIVAWCLCFLVFFIVLNLVLGRVARVWRK